ncbi:hypothetical protein [Neobacillus ginsengisoli]|uniref:Lipoprotein n=1 Tax=Neobacillus ginsengisoli TaxID=904295 RepID=A0ABT9Y034_9BACI|nr:hypothetical protein [Neobacillus ginsengisoli]MDQ0201173.1 hypothetical protein [Neobacillus ginsengisoli]
MSRYCYQSFTIISLSMSILLMSSCGQSQRKDDVPNIVRENTNGIGKPSAVYFKSTLFIDFWAMRIKDICLVV